MRLLRFLPLLLACLALAGVGCGSSDDDNGGGGGDSSQPAETTDDSGGGASGGGGNAISMKNIQFDPKETTVKVGDKVTWTNDDDVDHNVVAREGADFSSDTFGKGGTYSFTPTKAGKIEYTCTLHPGMDGELEVTS
jgi:plastocyanin